MILLNEKQRREFFIKKNYPDIYNDLVIFKEKLKFDTNFSQLLYHYNYNIVEKPKCKICNNDVKFKNYNNGYNTYCSKKCVMSDKNIINKRNNKSKKTNLEKYGVDNPMKDKKIIKKMINSNKKNHDGIFSSKIDEVKEKIKKTNLEKYGVETYLKTEEFKIKKRNTNIKKYGNEYYTKVNDIKEKIKKTNLEKYGNENYLKSEDFKMKLRMNNQNKYNGFHHMTYKKNNNLLSNFYKKISLSYYNNILDKSDYEILNIKKDELTIKHHNCDNIFNIKKQLLYLRLKNDLELCTVCNKLSKPSSNIENDFFNYINEILPIKKLKNNRNIIFPYELDIYIPELKIAFEFNGLYWHNELHKDKNYHLNKTELCEKNNIQLIHIWEDDWTYKQEIVKSMILNKLDKTPNKIYARKTEVREINDNKLVREFLEKNHIQGFIGSKIKLGLFYDNELVSLMTFGKRRIAMGNKKNNEGEYELLRFCSKLNTSIVGGANKLFKYFIKNYNPKEIITYADRSISNGNLYYKLGFEYKGKTEPNYYYIVDGIRHHRFNFRKDKLVKEGYDPSLTEHQIMLGRNIYRIYDSGNLKFYFQF